MYQNTGYSNNRNRKRTLILDVSDEGNVTPALGPLASGKEFNIELFEPLIIDKHSEVYLDNFLSYNSNIGQTPQTSAFLLKINEFNMNSNVASSKDNNQIYNSLIIPNEHKSVSNNHSAIIHKGKKFNYVCDINPQTIHSISGKITDLKGDPTFHGDSVEHGFTYSLVGIDTGKLDVLIQAFTSFNSITAAGVALAGPISGAFIATHYKSANTLHFVTNTEIDAGDLGKFKTNQGDIIFRGASFAGAVAGIAGDITVINNAATDNLNLHLISSPGRFIAEFSIISRE